MAQNVSTRVTQLEESMGRAFRAIEALAEKQEKLDDVLVLLAEAQIETQKQFQETERRFQETERQFQETEKRFQVTEKRFQRTDAILEQSRLDTGEWFREFDARLAQSKRETDEQHRQNEALFAKLKMEREERGRILDERIANLVSAIGELVRRGWKRE